MADPVPDPDARPKAATMSPAVGRTVHEARTVATIVRGRAQLLRRRWQRGRLEAHDLETGVRAIEVAAQRLEALARRLERGVEPLRDPEG
jgi:hypothetical protein